LTLKKYYTEGRHLKDFIVASFDTIITQLSPFFSYQIKNEERTKK